MKNLLLLSLLTSCSHYQSSGTFYHRMNVNRPIYKTYETRQVGIKCPNNTYYSFETGLCESHYIDAESSINGVSINAIKTYKDTNSSLKPLKTPLKRLLPKKHSMNKLDCESVYKAVNQCMGGK